MPKSTLFAAYLARRPLLLRRLARLLGCTADAEDLAQDTWLRACGTLVTTSPAALIDRIATNLALDRRRSLARRIPAAAGALEALPSDLPDAERTLLDRDRVRRAEVAIAAMPPRRRAVFLAVRLEGLSHAAVAARFGITTAAVEKHVARAMLDLTAGDAPGRARP